MTEPEQSLPQRALCSCEQKDLILNTGRRASLNEKVSGLISGSLQLSIATKKRKRRKGNFPDTEIVLLAVRWRLEHC